MRPQPVEDPVEVVVFVLRELPAEPDLPADGPHELGVEARVDAVIHHLERRVREGGRDEQRPGLDRLQCRHRSPLPARFSHSAAETRCQDDPTTGGRAAGAVRSWCSTVPGDRVSRAS
jgi:hypothetical protein